MPIFANQPELPKRAGGWAARLIPLIAMFTGLRLEEIAQLRCADVVVHHQGAYFDITKDRGNLSFDEVQRTKDDRRSLKTISSKRIVPVHSRLIELGLLDYVAVQRAKNCNDLFPNLPNNNSRKRSGGFSKFWGDYTDRFVTVDTGKVFHSFRHLFIDKLRGRTDEIKLEALVGHARKSTGRRYGAGFDMMTLKVEIEKLDFPGLDFGSLRLPAATFK